MSRIWRVRLKYGGTDFTSVAWKKGEIGIWYGGWSASDFTEAAKQSLDNEMKIVEFLSALPTQKALKWSDEIPLKYIQTARRFRDIEEQDWVVVHLTEERQIGLARLRAGICSREKHELNLDGEIYKYREVIPGTKKSFSIDDLPDAYRLIGSQGQGNVFEFAAMLMHVKLLVECEDVQAVRSALQAKPFSEQLDYLGAAGWESFALAYLIITENFVPTGLATGRTLPVEDLVGRRFSDGARIIAQCKKNAGRVKIDDRFKAAAMGLGSEGKAFYFAYGGCSGEQPESIEVVDRGKILKWVDSVGGRQYRGLLFSG